MNKLWRSPRGFFQSTRRRSTTTKDKLELSCPRFCISPWRCSPSTPPALRPSVTQHSRRVRLGASWPALSSPTTSEHGRRRPPNMSKCNAVYRSISIDRLRRELSEASLCRSVRYDCLIYDIIVGDSSPYCVRTAQPRPQQGRGGEGTGVRQLPRQIREQDSSGNGGVRLGWAGPGGVGYRR